jgi:alpha-glucuronidase
VLSDSAVIQSTRDELIRGVRGMTGRTLRIETGIPAEDAIVLGTLPAVQHAFPESRIAASLGEDGYLLRTVRAGPLRRVLIAGQNDRGVLYGTFALLRKIGSGQPVGELDEQESPYAPIRWVNQWDNLDGSIERGYGGRSIFWEAQHARSNLSRVTDYGRMLASLGINGCSVNNVNANPRILAPGFLPEVVRIADTFRPWGVHVVLAVDFASPKSLGGLDSFDPLDPRVAAWWEAKAAEVYRAIPDLGGFVMKADSEGRAGPSAYGRTPADAANVVARALKPHGGVLLYRAFVYDHHMDWRNPKNDRARAAYDIFHPLDGRFEDNVVIQIKNGPIDFQVREPVSPLFGGLAKTRRALELQITQEYMGQARQLVFLVPQWKEALGAIQTEGFAGVANVGLDDNWAGNQLSQANLYGFGRLTWNPKLSAEQIAEEWTRLTFGPDREVIATLSRMLLTSWRTYEDYTGPLGLQTLTDITGNHYGVNVEASEENSWGQWHRADHEGVGMDRTIASGTGYVGQYPAGMAALWESPVTCPDDLLLFFHHGPYTHRLHSGQTVIQYIYDSHYNGAKAVEQYVRDWKSLAGRIDEQRYQEVLAMLEYQAGQAEVWRDAVTNWFLRTSGIPDEKGRVGHYPGRVEAESMKLEGYAVVAVTPWEAASGGQAVECRESRCVASFRYDGPAGWREIRVQYFDQNNGTARYRVSVGKQLVDEWAADDHLPAAKIDGSSSKRRSISGIALRPGDEIRIEGIPDGGERAALDYAEILAAPVQLR